MFEHYKGAKTQKRPAWVGVLIAVSVAVHVLGGGAMIVHSMWVIDKLAVPEGQVELSLGAPPPPPPPKGGGKKQQDDLKNKIKKVKVKEAVQPVDPNEIDEAELADAVDSADEGEDFGVEGGVEGGVAGGVVGGVLGGVPGGTLGGTGGPPPPPEPEQPKVVPQVVLKENRISGNERIVPPDAVKNLMVKQGEAKLVATVKMCLDKAGQIASVRTVKSSGYAEYDQKILGQMRGWKYRPFKVNGRAVPVCTAVTFIYRQQ